MFLFTPYPIGAAVGRRPSDALAGAFTNERLRTGFCINDFFGNIVSLSYDKMSL